MTLHHLSIDRLGDDLRYGAPVPEWARPGEPNVVVVDPFDHDRPAPPVLPASTAAVVLAIGDPAARAPDWCDLLAGVDDVDRIAQMVDSHPIASTALVQVLRGAEARSMTDGVVLESAVYSALQAGPEFARWRASNPRRERAEPDEPPVVVDRDGNMLRVRLNRPHVHNALSARLRDALLEALEPARLDPSLTVEISGNGPSYSAGGDLDEFGTLPDPASAHLVRTATALGPLLASLAGRVTVVVHGACAGSGIEIPAFAGHITGRPDVAIWLPELGLGLIPGAGGTWSLPQRIGRHRTAWLALTGRRISLPEALDWGLVDTAAGDP